MANITESIIINAPIEKVFGYVTDPANGSKFVPGIIEQTNISPKTAKVGQKWDWHVNLIGVELHGKGEVMELEPLKKWVVKTCGDADSFRTYCFEPSGDGTKLTIIVESTVLKGALAALAAVVVDGIHQVNLKQSLAKLKEILETTKSV
ncbi:hypothetical protein EPN15_04605 [Patescibacteria group bacterium]|nr:MAG: hypothetical protein EPN15_04605 [Patescibacteria group bacterium]